jgi:hypothetical protein
MPPGFLADLQSSTGSDVNGAKVSGIQIYTFDVIGTKWRSDRFSILGIFRTQGFPEIGDFPAHSAVAHQSDCIYCIYRGAMAFWPGRGGGQKDLWGRHEHLFLILPQKSA